MIDKKVAVVLLNLGGPDNLDSVENFLFNLFYDKYIITLPNPFRWIIAKIISKRRVNIAKEIYGLIGGKSPILQETELQKNTLKEKLKGVIREVEVFVCMRHWHPMSDEVSSEIKKYAPEEIIILPLYPQFSSTTTKSSVEDLKNALLKREVKSRQKVIGCYFNNGLFIEAWASLLKPALKNLDKNNTRVLFSAHSLPEKIIKSGDPYQWQVENTVNAVVKTIKEKLDYIITYQSKVGPIKWLEPSTESEIEKAAKDGKTIVVVPIAFVSEHVETLVELDMEYKKISDKYGAKYIRVGTLSTNEIFIDSLKELIVNSVNDKSAVLSRVDVCPCEFSMCMCREGGAYG